MKRDIPITRRLNFLCVLALCTVLLLPVAALAEGKRGDDPACQEDCLGHHSEHMAQLSREYERVHDKTAYQDRVEDELLKYSHCLRNCRRVLPVK